MSEFLLNAASLPQKVDQPLSSDYDLRHRRPLVNFTIAEPEATRHIYQNDWQIICAETSLRLTTLLTPSGEIRVFGIPISQDDRRR